MFCPRNDHPLSLYLPVPSSFAIPSQEADEVNLRGKGQQKVSDLVQMFQDLTDKHQ